MCDKAVDIYPSIIQFIPECYKSQKICYKAGFDSILDQYKIQEICDIVVSWYPFLIVYCSEKYKWMCDEAVNDSLAALKLIPNWFVTSKIIKELYTALHEDNGLLVRSHFVVMK